MKLHNYSVNYPHPLLHFNPRSVRLYKNGTCPFRWCSTRPTGLRAETSFRRVDHPCREISLPSPSCRPLQIRNYLKTLLSPAPIRNTHHVSWRELWLLLARNTRHPTRFANNAVRVLDGDVWPCRSNCPESLCVNLFVKYIDTCVQHTS